VMTAQKRKTPVVCKRCYNAIHIGRLTPPATADRTTPESRALRKA
jgi:hypothetical protein